MGKILEIDRLNVRYGAFEAVKSVSLHIDAGTTLGIAGESGSGKSTLAMAIPRLLPLSATVSGDIQFSGNSILQINDNAIQRIRGAQIGVVFQEPMSALNPLLPCGPQVAEILRHHQKISAVAAADTTRNWFEKVRLPDISRIYNAYPHELSGGQQQRVLIAMALCCHPSLLIADEPTTALDVTVQKSILDLLKDLQQELGLSMLFISHDLGVISYMCDQVAVMHQGRIVETGPTADVLQRPVSSYTKELTNSRAKLAAAAVASAPDGRPVLFDDPSVAVHYPVGKNFFGQPAGWLTAVDQVPVTIYQGECLGVLGESGSGKSSLGREIAARMGGAKGGAVVVFQNPQAALNPRMEAGEAVMEPLLANGLVKNKKEAREKAMELFIMTALGEEHFHRLPKELSGGQKQRLCLARALAVNPRLLICDEIVSALDMTIQVAILELLKDLQVRLGLTLLFISHDMSAIRKVCDRVLVMQNGRVEESGTVEQVFSAPVSPYTVSLLAAAV